MVSTIEPGTDDHDKLAVPFVATPATADSLQATLVDLIVLQLQAKQAHWNVIGKGFRAIHLQLDEIADAAREHSDVIAERMRSIGSVPDGRGGTIVKTTTLQPYPADEIEVARTVDLMTQRLAAVVATARRAYGTVAAEDPPSADKLNAVIDGLERLNWMLAAEGR